MELWIEVGGDKVRVHAQMLQSKLWVHFRGHTFVIDTAAGRKGTKKAGSGSSSDVLKAPMPGKITKLLCHKGDVVTKGQSLAVMEAMKMEYTLKAEIDGSVESVEAQVGQQVTLGQVLVRLTPGSKNG